MCICEEPVFKLYIGYAHNVGMLIKCSLTGSQRFILYVLLACNIGIPLDMV